MITCWKASVMSLFNFLMTIICSNPHILSTVLIGLWQTSQAPLTPPLVLLSTTSPSIITKQSTHVPKFNLFLIYQIILIHRERSCELWNAKAKHRYPQVCFSAVQAEEEGPGINAPAPFPRLLYYKEICWGTWLGSPCGRRLLQLPERNGCQETVNDEMHIKKACAHARI